MWCLTPSECESWCKSRAFELNAGRHPVSGEFSITVPLTKVQWSQLTSWSRLISNWIESFDECLLWVTLTGVWPSTENLHLFYRLRESYGERRLLNDAPGHLFLAHEVVDLATFIELGLICGWDFCVLPNLKHGCASISHDGFLHLYTDSPAMAEEACKLFEGATRDR